MVELRNALTRDLRSEIDQAELRGFARSVSEIEWLLLILVAIYLVAPGFVIPDRLAAAAVWMVFAFISLLFRFLPAFRRQTRGKIAVQTFVMVAFATAMTFLLDTRSGHLLTLFLLPVIVSALTLGRWITLVVVVLASVGYLAASFLPMPAAHVNLGVVMSFAAHLAPFLLIATVTSMLAYEMEIAKSRIRTLSETDELTGLNNVRAFSRILRREHERSVRHRRSYAILAVDVNNLKKINDTYGHDIGNRVIVLVANVIARLIRASDAAARFGGDEFVVLLAETTGENAQIVAKRIAQTIERSTIEISGSMVRPSVSIGVATFPDDGEEAKDLMVRADLEMYRQKEAIRAQESGVAPGKPGVAAR